MRIILLGKNGQVGKRLYSSLKNVGHVFAYDSLDLDLRDTFNLVRTLENIRPNVIINAAAYTKVDRAEVEPNLAMQVNAAAPKIIAEVSKSIHAVLIHFSTDYVFDGQSTKPYKEDDFPNPINMYGKSKLAGEKAIQDAGCAFLILRTSWVYSGQGDNFLTKILSLSKQSHKTNVVTDQIGSPTWAGTLAETIVKLIPFCKFNRISDFVKYEGVYNVADLGSVSRLEWAKAILQNDPSRKRQIYEIIQPSLSSEFSTLARRPLFSALNCEKIQKTFNISLQNWEIRLSLAMKEPVITLS